jgi:hypothetical protein
MTVGTRLGCALDGKGASANAGRSEALPWCDGARLGWALPRAIGSPLYERCSEDGARAPCSRLGWGCIASSVGLCARLGWTLSNAAACMFSCCIQGVCRLTVAVPRELMDPWLRLAVRAWPVEGCPVFCA